MIVPSTDTIDRSRSPDNSLTRRSQRFALAQRRNRLKTRVHRPKCGGRSRQGVPVRNRQRTPSRKRRLSTAVRPGSVTLPGHSGATRAHISSVKTVRSEFILSPTSSARAAFFGVQSRHKDTISAQDARQLSTGLSVCPVKSSPKFGHESPGMMMGVILTAEPVMMSIPAAS